MFFIDFTNICLLQLMLLALISAKLLGRFMIEHRFSPIKKLLLMTWHCFLCSDENLHN